MSLLRGLDKSDHTNCLHSSWISENRKHAYSCFYHFLVAVKYHAGLGLFFHYYSHLWHPACRPFRGKQSLIEDIGLVGQDLEASQASQASEASSGS